MDVSQQSNCNWHLWCRLCAKADIQNNISVFMKHDLPSDEASPAAKAEVSGMDKYGGDHTLANAIGKYFWINITRGEELPQMICNECLTLVTSLVNFSKHATRVQNFYCALQSMPKQEESDLNELRRKFGLLENDHEPMLLEMTYVEEKPRISEYGLLEKTNPPSLCIQNLDELDDKTGIIINNAYAENEDEVDTDDQSMLQLCGEDAVTVVYNENADAADDDMSSVDSARSSKTSTGPKQRMVDPQCYKCIECMRTYARAYSLKRHIQQKHTQTIADEKRHMDEDMRNRKVYPCSNCDRKFISIAAAMSHEQLMHPNERPKLITCDQCGVSAHTKSALEEHMLTHTDYAPYECSICKKYFKSAARLSLHKETHDPDKFFCPDCGLQVNSEYTLNRHRKIHTDKEQHICDYCGREFRLAKTLKNHLLLHTGMRPYSCEFCDRTFVNSSNCREHQKKAHPKQLAAQDAASGSKSYSNIPHLEEPRAFTKNIGNLSAMDTEQSGCLASGQKMSTNDASGILPTEVPLQANPP